MVAVKVIFGGLGGALVGLIGGFVLCLGVSIVVGLIAWDADTGATVGGVVWLLCIWAGGAIGFVVPLKIELDRQNAEKAAGLEAEEASRRAEVERRKALKAHLAHLLTKSRNDHAGLSFLVAGAESHLDTAEREFAERAFAPFWDEIEHAIHKLAAYRNGVSKIAQRAIQYRAEASNAPFSVVPFSLPMHELPDARPTAQRLAAVVRKAQKDFHFATIFEQRKTNKILVAGFSTLVSAIYEIGDAISSSLDDLSNNLHTSLGELFKATKEQTELARSAAEKHAEILRQQGKQQAADSAQRREAERKVVECQQRQEEMLDNIQRRRKP